MVVQVNTTMHVPAQRTEANMNFIAPLVDSDVARGCEPGNAVVINHP